MLKVFLFILFIGLVIGAALIFQGNEKTPEAVDTSLTMESNLEEKNEIIREPAVAGQFYSADSQELRKEIDQFLNNVDLPEIKGEISALILPHAGYQFSGQVAAWGFKNLIDQEIDTVILIGNSHQQRFEGISVFEQGFYKTPLGKIEIDAKLAKEIINEDERISFKEAVHQQEHSLEVELPFLQRILEDFKIIPIIFGNTSNQDYQILAQAISKNIKGKNVLLIASSDLSHYPSYQDAQYADSKIIEAILTGKVEELEKINQGLEEEGIPNAVTFVCGIDAIKTIMLVFEKLGAGQIKLLNKANSGDVSGDKGRVVGYASIGFFGERRGSLLNKAEQKKLLEISKTSVESFVKEGKTIEFQVEDDVLNQNLGAFVTLRKNGQLRGCIGRFSPTKLPLYQVVSQMAVAAASEDKRFYPITKEELVELHYEVSVLSPLREIDDWQEIELGKHGVQIKKGMRSGVFLPQVATENNWDLDKFMGELCSQKAGLSWTCWKEKDIELYVFTAQIFEED